jgi:hypothetical protein
VGLVEQRDGGRDGRRISLDEPAAELDERL